MKTPFIKNAEIGERIRFGCVGDLKEARIIDALMFGNQKTGYLLEIDGKHVQMSLDQLIDKYAHVID
jgi:hypothetical protein